VQNIGIFPKPGSEMSGNFQKKSGKNSEFFGIFGNPKKFGEKGNFTSKFGSDLLP
jgi:hypothetical protein